MDLFPHRRAALIVLAATLVTVAACGGGVNAANDPASPGRPDATATPRPDEPASSFGGPSGDDPAGDGNGALRVRPEPGITDARPHAWDHIDVASDGRTLTVYYYGGVQDCYGLSDVKVGRDKDGALRITVLEGIRKAAADRACIEIAVLKAVTVTLDEPLVTSGS